MLDFKKTTCSFLFLALIHPSSQANASNPKKLDLKRMEATKSNTSQISRKDPKLKGWDYFYKIMVEAGVDSKQLRKVIADKRMPTKKPMHFKLKPKESKYLYRKHNTSKNRQNALSFYKKHSDSFDKAHQQYGVHPSVILSILQVETFCGGYTGKKRVFHRLARLSSAADVPNILENLKKKQKKDPSVHYRDVLDRAQWLENEFLPHAIATLKLAKNNKKHPLEIKGSGAGAIGLYQFLPGNVFKFGVDGNYDNKVDPFHPEDAIPSVANFLASYGWDSQAHLGDKNHHSTIWNYNRSDSYIETVLAMAKKLAPELEAFNN